MKWNVTKEGRSVAERDMIRTFVSQNYLIDDKPIEGIPLRDWADELHARFDNAMKKLGE